MCSIWGFVGTKGNTVNIITLAEIIAANIQRGPHAMGFSWINKAGRLRCWKAPGNPMKMLGMLKQMRDATMVIGHLRYSTHGDPKNNINNHPHPCDGGWIVHNGVIHNERSLISKYRLNPVSECDSEVIGLLAEKSEETTAMGRLISAVDLTGHSDLTVMGLWNRKRQLVAIRRGNPLHITEVDDGFYIGSLKAGLPGTVNVIKDYSAVRFTQRGIMVDIERDEVARPQLAKWPAVTSPGTAGGQTSFVSLESEEQSEFERMQLAEMEELSRDIPSTLAAPKASKTSADDKWWHHKPGSRKAPQKASEGGPTGVNADGTVTGEYRGG